MSLDLESFAIGKANGGGGADVDETLTKSGWAADAKVTGDELKLRVKTINGNAPDENGNVDVESGSGNTNGSPEDYIHISFDDVTKCISNLINNTYTSLWEEPFFAFLKEMHDTYGAKFSLYVFDIDNLPNVPATYKSEFLASSNWLKFGLHSRSVSHNYASATYSQGQADWNNVVTNVTRFAGTYKSIDRIPRLGNFAGSLNALKGMRDGYCGAMGFLSADDNRTPYYLTSDETTYLRTHDTFIDKTNGLVFYHTDLRAEDFKTVGVYNTLTNRIKDVSYADTFKSFIFFTHEYEVYNGTAIKNRNYVEDACRFAKEYNIPFDFPQNRLGISLSSIALSQTAVIPVTGVTLSNNNISIGSGNTATINATVTPENATNSSVNWSVDNANVSISANGKSCTITGVATGTSVVTVTTVDGNFTARCTVTVASQSIPCTGITLDKNNLSFDSTSPQTLIATPTPSDTTDTITWEASDSAVATVNNGVVTPKAVQNKSCTITARCGNYSANCDVAVDVNVIVGTVIRDIKTGGTFEANKVSSVSGMHFLVHSESNQYGKFEDDTKSVGRATAKEVLVVNGGETIKLIQNLPSKRQVNMAIVECVEDSNNTAVYAGSGENYTRWISDNCTLQSGTRLLCITFKAVSGSGDFSDEDLAALPNCLEVI